MHLIGLALGFMFLFLVLPLLAVFTEALRLGWGACFEALRDPYAMSAIRLTLLVAAITVPLSLVFGAQGWFGPWLDERGIQIIFAVPGIVLATLFITFPFIARAMGEFGAVSVVSGHILGQTNTMPLHVEVLNNEFQSVAAFAVVSLQALLGPSGCGKTTLLRIIAGLETPEHGHILFSGQDTTDVHVRERNVGFVFQHYALFRHMTVFENVAFGLRVKPRRERPSEAQIKERVHELLGLVQLDWLADRYPSQLSGGQRKRIALALALGLKEGDRVLLSPKKARVFLQPQPA